MKSKTMTLTCHDCGKKYDLIRLVETTKGRDLHCPNCGKRIGTKS